jgi:hypothetical protein
MPVVHFAADAPTHKDAVIAELAAAGALVGFVLVFVGILAGSYQSLLGNTPRDKLAPFRQAAILGLVVFGIGLAAIASGAAWLLAGGGEALYVLTTVFFLLELGGLLLIAGVSWKVLLR